MSGKNYRETNIREEINKKINTIDKTRTNRIFASERLYNYSKKWEVVFFLMNVLAIIFLISSTLVPSAPKLMIFVSGCFSLYTIITQYYYNNLNYRERGLKFHYLELDLERLVIQLKTLLRNMNMTDSDLEREYSYIMNNYISSLKGYENHEDIDNEKRKEIDHKLQILVSYNLYRIKRYIKWDSDSIFYRINLLIIILFFVLYITSLCNSVDFFRIWAHL